MKKINLEERIDDAIKKIDKKIDYNRLEKEKWYYHNIKRNVNSKVRSFSDHFLFIFGIFIMLFVSIGIVVLFNTLGKKDDIIINNGKYAVKVNIDFKSNIFFNTYDVKLNIENASIIIPHGKSKTIKMFLDKGEYSLIFENADDSTIRTEEVIEVYKDISINYKINCKSKKINVESLNKE